MDRLFACLDDMGGFPDSNITHTPTLYIHHLCRITNIHSCLLRVVGKSLIRFRDMDSRGHEEIN
jgi:hypothetical protein